MCIRDRSYINGATLITDAGWYAAGLSGGFPAATPAAQFLAGRFG